MFLLFTECGVPPLFPRPETRIVGGRNAPFGGWPWQVNIDWNALCLSSHEFILQYIASKLLL
jgi:hypothetical protein